MIALATRGRTVATVSEVASDLESFVRYKQAISEYDAILFIGHSLGGLVTLTTVDRLLKNMNTKSIMQCLLLASPQVPHSLAKLLILMSRSNPHLLQLASKREMNRVVGVVLDNIRTRGVGVTYIHHSLDELISFNEDIEFDVRESCEATHSWMKLPSTRKTPAYRLLVAWIKRAKG
ncbi:MAG: hypothetical protein ACE368_13445 [Paracoccaceae bacterium]